VLRSVTAPSFLAGLALEHARTNARLQETDVGRAPGQLDGTRRETGDVAFLVREALARALDTARRSAEIQSTAAELAVIAEDLCSRARAEREYAQELASERLGHAGMRKGRCRV
jgi:hypothetical protein